MMISYLLVPNKTYKTYNSATMLLLHYIIPSFILFVYATILIASHVSFFHPVWHPPWQQCLLHAFRQLSPEYPFVHSVDNNTPLLL